MSKAVEAVEAHRLRAPPIDNFPILIAYLPWFLRFAAYHPKHHHHTGRERLAEFQGGIS